jgi:hypothetical protein
VQTRERVIKIGHTDKEILSAADRQCVATGPVNGASRRDEPFDGDIDRKSR